jgi:predicted amidohydrolase
MQSAISNLQSEMRCAALQFFATPFDLTRNLETAERLIRAAAAQGAQLVVLPELFNTGYVYTPRLFAFAETEDGLTLGYLVRLSSELKVYLAGPLLLREGAPSRVFNVFVLIEPDGKIHKYRKQNPFLWERCYFEAGHAPLVVETELGRIGLMTCWDITRRDIWEAYQGRVDVLLIASAPPRFHRAVLNFPLGKKVYLAQMMPALLHDRDKIDNWFLEDIAERAAWLGAPIVHAVMAGRFVTEVPFPRLGFLAAAFARPRLWPLAAQAHLASLRATFYGTSAIFSAQGETLAHIESPEGIALADISSDSANDPAFSSPKLSGYFLPKVPMQLQVMEWLMRPVAKRYYRQRITS